MITWWDGGSVTYGEQRRVEWEKLGLIGLPKCPRCKRRMRNVAVRDMTIFGSEFRPILLHPRCAESWDGDEL